MTEILRTLILWLLCWILPVAGLCIGIYFLSTLPVRRREQARFFLDILEHSLRSGESPEHVITAVARTREKAVGARFHLLAAYIESGMNLRQALEFVPSFLPAAVSGMLRSGSETGDLPKAIRAARQAFGIGLKQAPAGLHYAFVTSVLMAAFALVYFPLWRIFILPKFVQLIADGTDAPMPPFLLFLNDHGTLLSIGYALIVLALVATFALFIGMPTGFARTGFWGWIGSLISQILPWRRKRLQRDFSLSLGLLLESDVPEAKAVLLAARSTGNLAYARKGLRMARQLEGGLPLVQALSRVDRRGELEWRLANALQNGSFLGALKGWHEALENEAWQSEQLAGYALGAGMLLLNGVVVASLVIAVFTSLVSVLEAGLLW